MSRCSLRWFHVLLPEPPWAVTTCGLRSRSLWEVHRGVRAWGLSQQLLERTCPLIPLCEECAQIEQACQSRRDGRMLPLTRVAGTLLGLLYYRALIYPRTDQHCCYSQPQSPEVTAAKLTPCEVRGTQSKALNLEKAEPELLTIPCNDL